MANSGADPSSVGPLQFLSDVLVEAIKALPTLGPGGIVGLVLVLLVPIGFVWIGHSNTVTKEHLRDFLTHADKFDPQKRTEALAMVHSFGKRSRWVVALSVFAFLLFGLASLAVGALYDGRRKARAELEEEKDKKVRATKVACERVFKPVCEPGTYPHPVRLERGPVDENETGLDAIARCGSVLREQYGWASPADVRRNEARCRDGYVPEGECISQPREPTCDECRACMEHEISEAGLVTENESRQQCDARILEEGLLTDERCKREGKICCDRLAAEFETNRPPEEGGENINPVSVPSSGL